MREKIKTAKGYSVGLHVATGNFTLGKDIIVWLKKEKRKRVGGSSKGTEST